MPSAPEREPVLSVRGLAIDIGGLAVVDGVDFDVAAGGVLALVGESGSGKSLTALAIMGLLPAAARAVAGDIRLAGRPLLGLAEAEMRAIRGREMAMIFQEPVASLNPLMRVGEQVAESLVVHGQASGRAARRLAVEMLAQVGIADPERRARHYPAQLSGGMCQRVMIASALIARPRLLIADEPTTALDVTIQAQILTLMKGLRRNRDMAVLIITHDMGVVADIADRVCVMYGGRIVETGAVAELFARPRHPYTRLLLSTIPKLTGARKGVLRSISGSVPDLADWPAGCRFRSRCPLATERCAAPPPTVAADGHRFACWHADRVEEMA